MASHPLGWSGELPEPFYAFGDHIAVDLPGARAVFTTRRGGSSFGPYAHLNLGILTDDDPALVTANRASIAAQLGVSVAYARQVHRADVRIVEAGTDPSEALAEGDAIATAVPGVAPMVLAADCLPIAIAGGGAVAMAHAGWPGLAAGVVTAAVAAVRHLAGGAAVIAAAIGPGAGPCCYEVGDELRVMFGWAGPAAQPGRNLDLKLIARRQLEAAGVQRVDDVGVCTICAEPSLLFSHRRDSGVTGRQAGIGWLS